MAQIYSFAPQDLANTAWAWAVLAVRNVPMLASIAGQAIAPIHDFLPQNLSNTAWALATLQCNDGPLLAAISPQARPRIGELQA